MLEKVFKEKLANESICKRASKKIIENFFNNF